MFLAGSLTVLVLTARTLVSPHEPLCQGRPVGAWVAELGDNSYAATRALRETGPDAIPALIRALEKEPAGWLNVLAFARDHAPWFARPKLRERGTGDRKQVACFCNLLPVPCNLRKERVGRERRQTFNGDV